MLWTDVPSSETNRGSDGWMLVRTLACTRTGRSAGTVMIANRFLGNPTDRDENGGLRNRRCQGAGLRPLGKPRELPPYPTVHARRSSIQTTCDSYVPNLGATGSSLGSLVMIGRLRSDHKILARITRACGATPAPVRRGCLHAIQNLWFRQPISAKSRHWESVPSNI